MENDTEVLRIRNLCKAYAGGGGVQDLTISIGRGRSFGLLGPNGAGKSTALKMIMGLLGPDSGTISVLGQDVLAEPDVVRRRVGYVPEHQNMYPWMRVSELVWFVRSFYPTWNDALCQSLLTDFGLPLARRVRELSNGMQTKLALALALSHEPEFLVLDEPTTRLDPLVREEFLEKVQQMVRTNQRTVLFSSHMMSDVEKIADTIGIINNGQMLIVARRDELLTSTHRISALLEGHDGVRVAPPGTVYETYAGGRWNLTVQGNPDTIIEALRTKNKVLDVSLTKPDLEGILKDYIRGNKIP